jgi:hypothetical protein
MKKYMLLIAASLVAGALVTGCGSPAEGNVGDASNTVTPAGKPMGESPAGGAPAASLEAPVEDKK